VLENVNYHDDLQHNVREAVVSESDV